MEPARSASTAPTSQRRDLCLLRCQLTDGVDGASANMLAGRFQLDACALGERLHAEVGEEVVRCPQLPSCSRTVRRRTSSSTRTSDTTDSLEPFESMEDRWMPRRRNQWEPLAVIRARV
jgi:hypothetical protein